MNIKRILLVSTLALGLTTCSIGFAHADNEESNTVKNVKEGSVLDQSALEKLLEINSEQTTAEEKKQEVEEKKEDSVAAPSPQKADKLISVAKSKLGSPYVYGSTGPYSFDCSGFTTYVYRQMGISLPRVASSQAYGGKKVNKGDLQKGDLVFFNTYGGISHVGIYIEGGNFVHASSYGGGVVISNLNDSYYVSRYVTAARYM